MIDSPTLVTEKRAGSGGKGYQYKHGDRPLDGFTIQRGAGRGGFGEVYYALSDSGREVALKVVHTYEQIELRGISQCMNLKSPHLVTIFDVKTGEDGRPWVIMEFVAGPSLRELLDAAPSGLGVQKAAFFLREIGKGLTYLHDCGIVHRDLKPANIFYENGYVKIGDYGLSKLITASQNSGQTVTVGTVHYMAPEIGVGRYDKGIDIYAMGALLFEMLTGQVPFFGASPSEVLMKHLNSTVDTSGIEEPFAGVIRKAMAKDPLDRYQNVQEMVEAVFGAEHVRNSVSHFSPDTLTTVAGHAAQKISPSGSFTPSDAPAPGGHVNRWCRLGGMKDRFDRMLVQTTAGAGQPVANGADLFAPPSRDPLRLWQRIFLAVVAATVVAMFCGMIGSGDRGPDLSMFVWLGASAATAALVLLWRLGAPSLRHESPWILRLVLGGGAAVAALVLTFGFANEEAGRMMRDGRGTLLAMVLGLIVLDWPGRLAATRAHRITLANLVTAAVAGLIFSGIFRGNPIADIGVLVATALAAGLASGWNPRKALPGVLPAQRQRMPASPQPSGQALAPVVPLVAIGAPPLPPHPRHTVHRYVPMVWLGFSAGLVVLGLMLLIMAIRVTGSNGQEGPLSFGFGVGSLLLAAFCYVRTKTVSFTSYWTYLGRPLLRFACVQSILVSLCLILGGDLNDRDIAPALFFVIFPAVVLVLTFLVGRGGSMSYTSALVPARIAPVGTPISLGGIVFGLTRFALSTVGLVLLFASLVLGLAVVTNLPGLFASGTLDPRMPNELAENFGTLHWPEMLRHLGAGADLIVALIATVLLLLSRRHSGSGHMLRAVLAVVTWFAAVVALGRALPDWGDVVVAGDPGSTMEMYMQAVRMPGVLSATGLIIIGLFLFLWPPGRNKPVAAA